MYKKVLLHADLTPAQAEILNYLYQNKESKASEIAKKIKRSRAIVYKELEELSIYDIVEKEEKPNKVATFKAGHPSLLQKLLDKKEIQLKKDKQLLNNYLPDIISSYNLSNNKPGVRFYEGVDGIKKALDDTLINDKEVVYTYVDSQSVDREVSIIDSEYVKKRIKLGIRKKILMVENEKSIKYLKNYNKEFTEIKLVKGENIETFNSTAQIYNNKVAFITYENSNIATTIINDKNIYSMLRLYFESLWEKS